MSMKKKVLFVAYGGGHVNMVIPVIRVLEVDPAWQVDLLGLTTAGPVLARAGIPYFGFKDIVGEGDEAALEWGQRLSHGIASDVVPHEETVAYLGLSYADLEAAHGVEGAARAYAENGRHVFLPVNALKRFLGMVKPDLVVATNAPRAERAAIIAARELGIRTVCLLDLYPPEDGAWLKENWYGDKVCVLNQSAKDMLVRCGRDPDHVVVTGNPAFDKHYLFAANPERQRSVTGKVVVGFASNILPGIPGDTLQRAIFERLQQLCQEKNYQLALRQHPNETRWKDLGAAVNCSGMPIEEYLGSLDLLVTFPSTVALEAQIHGRRVALIAFTSLTETCSYLFNGDFEVIATLEDIAGLDVAPALGAGAGPVHAASASQNVCELISTISEES